ncbi:MAG TPA: hypothetical protein VI197_30165 [Polyangiaceae bacterium]
MRASVTFETITPESCAQGDFADYGWLAPNEYRVSLGNAGRNYGKRVRMSQRGRYDWSLGDAVRFILGKAENVRSEVDVDIRTGEPGRSWAVRVTIEHSQEDEGCAESVGYDLFIEGLSQGTADRLEALFVAAGCRLPFARSSSLRRAS